MYQDLHKNLMMFVLRGNYHIILGNDILNNINLGIARISQSEAQASPYLGDVLNNISPLDVVMDEPLAIAAVFMSFETNPYCQGLERFVSSYLADIDSAARGAAFEYATVIILASVLDGSRCLGEIFDFHSNKHSAMMSTRKARLVSILRWEGDVPVVCDAGLCKGASPVLGFAASSPVEVESWSKGMGVPFLLPDAHMGPDIWALVMVEDEPVWLAIQDKCLKAASLQPAKFAKATQSVTPGRFYINEVSFMLYIYSDCGFMKSCSAGWQTVRSEEIPRVT